jgi:hypothetical protein
MKKLLIYSFTILTALSVIVACRKNDNPTLPKGLVSVPELQFTKDATADAIIAAQTPDAFAGKFTLSLYFPSDKAPKNVDIMIIKNGVHSSAKLLKAGVTSFPATFTITGVQLKALFGASSLLGDSYDIGGTITTADGTVVPAFSAYQGAASYGSGLLSQGTTGPANTIYQPAAPTINYSAVCKFIMSDFGAVGAVVPFTVVSDGWADYAPGEPIGVTIVDATHFSFFYKTDGNPKPVVVTVDPATNQTSAVTGPIGSYSYLPTYGTWGVVNVPDAANALVFPCDLRFGVNVNFTSNGSAYTGGPIILKKS